MRRSALHIQLESSSPADAGYFADGRIQSQLNGFPTSRERFARRPSAPLAALEWTGCSRLRLHGWSQEPWPTRLARGHLPAAPGMLLRLRQLQLKHARAQFPPRLSQLRLTVQARRPFPIPSEQAEQQ